MSRRVASFITFLGIHGDLRTGERAAPKLLELDPRDSAVHVLLANMYREAGMWEEARSGLSEGA